MELAETGEFTAVVTAGITVELTAGITAGLTVAVTVELMAAVTVELTAATEFTFFAPERVAVGLAHTAVVSALVPVLLVALSW